MEELKVTPETIRGVAEAKVRYWREQVDLAASVLRTQGSALSLSAWEQALLLYNRSHRQLLAAEAHLENLPRAGGAK